MAGSTLLSRDVRVMVAPAQAFRAAAASARRVGWIAALRRPALFALILGTVTAVGATGRVNVSLVASGAICWSIVPALLVAAAAVAIGSSPRRKAGLAADLDLFFLGQGPWSLWLLAAAGWSTIRPPTESLQLAVLGSAVVPAVWTIVITFAFFRTVLGHSRREAVWRTCLHQGLVWSVIVTYVTVSSQLWPRIVGLLG